MGFLDFLKGKKEKTAPQEAENAMDNLFEITKDVKVDMKLVERNAKKYSDRMIHQDVKNPEEFQMRNHALYFSMKGNLEMVIEYATKGIKINPNAAYLFYMRGRSKGDLKLFKEGIKDLSMAISLKPKYADAFVERGYIKQKMGNAEGAEKDYKKAKEIDPSMVLPKH